MAVTSIASALTDSSSQQQIRVLCNVFNQQYSLLFYFCFFHFSLQVQGEAIGWSTIDHINQPHNGVDHTLFEVLCFWLITGFGIKLQPLLQPNCFANFAEGSIQWCYIFSYRVVIVSGLSSSWQQWYCYCSVLACCSSWKKGASQRCDRGIIEFFTGQRRTIDLSVGSLCPPLIHHHIHLSSSVHQPWVSRKSWELRIILLSVCCPVSQIPFLFPSTTCINRGWQCSHASIKIANGCLKRWDGSAQNNWPASKYISLCNNFLFISNFTCLSCSIYYSLFFHLHFTFGYCRKH